MEEKSINTEKSSGTLLRYWKRLKAYSVFWALLAIIVITSIIEPDFLNPSNLINIVRQTSINGILAVGMTFVIIMIRMGLGYLVNVHASASSNFFAASLSPSA